MQDVNCTIQDVIIIGGGLAGLISAIELARSGYLVTLIDRKMYPYHRVCGEYISNEVRPYLTRLGLDLQQLGAADIRQFAFTSPAGRELTAPLDLGGFGISRYRLDYALYELGMQAGVSFVTGKAAESVRAEGIGPDGLPELFTVSAQDGQQWQSRVVIGAFGKRSRLDKSLNRAFMQQPSPYVGVKYHVRFADPAAYARDRITLHNFQEGYCGMSAIEDDRFCLCYLTTRDNVRRHGSIAAMEEAVLYRNPHLKRIFTQAEHLYDKPEVINEVSFAPKQAVEAHLFMAGDSAGMITPLCGNGMAMAIHGARIASLVISQLLAGTISRAEAERLYTSQWNALFRQRLWVGRQVQRLFGDAWLSELALSFFKTLPPALHTVMRLTHGQEIR